MQRRGGARAGGCGSRLENLEMMSAFRRACGSAGWNWLFRGGRGEVDLRHRAAQRGRWVAGGEGE